MLTRHYKIF